jgi:phosphatidylserine/phosphatidylglycerophosphate/cardiolipin synthase-like enzyme
MGRRPQLTFRVFWVAFAAFAILFGTESRFASAEPEIHCAPVENLEHIDLELIRSATKSVDLAMYSLTDWAIIAALKDARTRGVTIRIVLDPSVRQAYDKLADVAETVWVKKRGPLMHLKAYAVDGILLRTGSANLSPSGLKQQDNDLIILRDPAVVAKFEARFGEVYAAAEPMSVEREDKKKVLDAPRL